MDKQTKFDLTTEVNDFIMGISQMIREYPRMAKILKLLKEVREEIGKL